MSLVINKVDTAGEWMVGANHLYIPSAGITIEHQNVAGSSSGRTEDGVMYIDWVRRDVYKVHLKWSAMSETELNNIITWMQGQEFVFKFVDRGVTKTINAYCGKCSYTFYTDNYLGLNEALYTDVTINVIEL